jgi:hypothetical protein
MQTRVFVDKLTNSAGDVGGSKSVLFTTTGLEKLRITSMLHFWVMEEN